MPAIAAANSIPDNDLPATTVTPPLGLADQAALAALVTTHSALLFRVAHSILRDRAAAEDTVQDTFLRALQHRHTLPAIRDLRPWLVRITWNLALDHRRRRHPRQLDDLFAASLASPHLPADQRLAETRELTRTLREIDRLPRAERLVLLLSALEELDHAEISSTLGRSPSATRALLFRARARLRQRLDQQRNPAAPKGSRP